MFVYDPDLYYAQEQINNFISILDVAQDNVILPFDTLSLKAAAIFNHSAIDPLISAKVLKKLDRIVGPLVTADDSLKDENILDNIRAIVDSTTLESGDVVLLPGKDKQILYKPKPQPMHYFSVFHQITDSSAKKIFEHLYFDDVVVTPYTTNTTLSRYIVENLEYSYSLRKVEWKKQLADFIKNVLYYDDILLPLLFVQDKITINSITYDVSDVPKFPQIHNLYPCVLDTYTTINNVRASNVKKLEMTSYYAMLDVRTAILIKPEMLEMFKIFPFKDDHFIDVVKNKIIYLNYKIAVPPLVQFILDDIVRKCMHSMDHILEKLQDLPKNVAYEELLSYTIHTKLLETQAIGLLALRYLFGPILRIKSINIKIPIASVNILLSYLPLCAKTIEVPTVLLPHHINAEELDVSYYSLFISDIVSSANNYINAAFICASYYIPELFLYDVYKNATTNEEKYVILSVILSQQSNNNIYSIRESLAPLKFGSKPIDIFKKYPPNNRLFNNQCNTNTITKELKHGVGQYKFTANYEQLNNLIIFGDAALNNEHLSSFIALNLQVKY